MSSVAPVTTSDAAGTGDDWSERRTLLSVGGVRFPQSRSLGGNVPERLAEGRFSSNIVAYVGGAILVVAVVAALRLCGGGGEQRAAQVEVPPWKAAAGVSVAELPLEAGASAARLAHVDPGPTFCNITAPLPIARPPRSFVMTEEWRQRCEKLEQRPDGVGSYPGRNWCWAWMKYEGCLWNHGHWSWWEAQERLSVEGRAPDPHDVPFEPILSAGICERPVLGRSIVYSPAEVQRANQWLAESTNIYVLNLPSETARWERMLQRLAVLGLGATRVFGIDMSKPAALDEVRSEGLMPPTFDPAAAQTAADFEGMGGIMGTMGVASAHCRALRTASRMRGDKPLALILEDDAELAEDFALRLWRLLAEAPCDWVAMSLKSRCAFGECVTPHLTRVQPDGNEPADRCHHGVNYGFYAMLYRAETLDFVHTKLTEAVWRDDRPHCLDVDVALASISDTVPYYAVPALQQPGFLAEGKQGSSRYKINSAAA